jgi:PAS domain S-box-containing protein
MLDALPDLGLTLLRDGEAHFANRRWCEYTGQSLKLALSNGWMESLHPDDRQQFQAIWSQQNGYQGAVDIAARVRRSDGQYCRFSFRFSPLSAAEEELAWCVWAAESESFDVPMSFAFKRRFRKPSGGLPAKLPEGEVQALAMLKAAEGALERARRELAHVSRATTFSMLTASIAHEVNQPLTGVLTNANTCLRLLASDPPNTEAAQITAQRIIRDAQRATEVIKKLRVLFSRRRLDAAPVDINEAAREIVLMLSAQLQRENVVVKTDLTHTLPSAAGDRVQLQQVIQNLVLNGAEAMRTIEDRPRELCITTSHKEDTLTLSVQDCGVGTDMPLENLFHAFYTTKSEGMGVGLSVSRSIVEAHGGRIWANKNVGPGLTFTISIPELDAGRSPGNTLDELYPMLPGLLGRHNCHMPAADVTQLSRPLKYLRHRQANRSRLNDSEAGRRNCVQPASENPPPVRKICDEDIHSP